MWYIIRFAHVDVVNMDGQIIPGKFNRYYMDTTVTIIYLYIYVRMVFLYLKTHQYIFNIESNIGSISN